MYVWFPYELSTTSVCMCVCVSVCHLFSPATLEVTAWRLPPIYSTNKGVVAP